MFRLLYTIISGISPSLLQVVGLFNQKIGSFLSDRGKGEEVTIGTKKFWIHCASLGEYEMAVPIIEELLKQHTLDDLLITFFSPSGYKQAIKGKFKSSIMYLPLDTIRNVNLFYKSYRPTHALFIRYDFWFNFISKGLKRGTNFYLVNGRFTTNHKIFGLLGKPYLKLINQFKTVFVSDNNSYNVLKNNGVQNIELTGDTRFDRVIQLKNSNTLFPEIELFKGGKKLLVLGSSWKPEEELLSQLLAQSDARISVIIAPHDIKRSQEIQTYFSKYDAKMYSEKNFGENDSVLIIDSIGMLSAIYRYADVALVGGGFSGALHNILEPAVWGNQIYFGPKTDKFPEAQDFIDAGFATKIQDGNEWIKNITGLLSDEVQLQKSADLAQEYVANQVGATNKIIKKLDLS